MKLQQRLSTLTRQLASARRDNDQDETERLEDEIDAVELEMEEEFNRRYETDW